VKLLLDTHIVLWAAYSPDRLSSRARELLQDESNTLVFSVATIWEVTIKRSLDRPDFTVDPHMLWQGLLVNGYEELPIYAKHALGVAALPLIHGDPFDRLLISQAVIEGLTLVTADRNVAQYEGPICLV
jgi:PIN domain nuclease of toxin-antitoxin system